MDDTATTTTTDDTRDLDACWARDRLDLMTEEQLASALRLNSVTTLATWRSQGKGPTFAKLGKRVFYTIADIKVWIERERYVPSPVAANDNTPRPADERVAA